VSNGGDTGGRLGKGNKTAEGNRNHTATERPEITPYALAAGQTPLLKEFKLQPPEKTLRKVNC